MWHVCLEGLKDVGSLCYGWRAEADVAWEGRTRFHPGLLICITLSCRSTSINMHAPHCLPYLVINMCCMIQHYTSCHAAFRYLASSSFVLAFAYALCLAIVDGNIKLTERRLTAT